MINQPLLPPEVVAVDRILKEEGGSTGGWDDADHERFLRYRTQFKGLPHIYCAKTAEVILLFALFCGKRVGVVWVSVQGF